MEREKNTYFCFGVLVTSVQCVPVQAQYGSLAKIHSPQLLWKLQFATGRCTIPECDDTNNKPCLMGKRQKEKGEREKISARKKKASTTRKPTCA